MMAEQNMQEFIEVLSSKAAVPGGGGACAYVCLLYTSDAADD